MLWMLSYVCVDTVIGRLPFEPWGIITGMTQRGLKTDDKRDVGLFFVILALQNGMRHMMPKLMGGKEGPRQPLERHIPKWAKSYMDKYS